MKRIIGKILITLGIIIIASVTYINYKVEKENKDMITQYKNAIAQSPPNENTDQQQQYKIGDTIGILSIPKINLEVALKEGVTKEVLDTSVGHFENTPMAGENGNFAIAGHRAYTRNKFFSELDKVEIGDEINILANNTNYKYIVNEVEVVTPDKVEVIQSTQMDTKEITLVTCTPKYIGSHRLIVKGTYKNP